MSDVEETPELGLYEIIFCVEGPNRNFMLYTTNYDFDHGWLCSIVDIEEDLRVMTIEDLETLIRHLQLRINEMKASN
jgi:hypothetical protein